MEVVENLLTIIGRGSVVPRDKPIQFRVGPAHISGHSDGGYSNFFEDLLES